MTLNLVIFLTNWQLICGRTKFLRGRRNLRDVIYFLFLHWSSDAALNYHQYSQVLELAQSLHFINSAQLLRKHTAASHRILTSGNDDKRPVET